MKRVMVVFGTRPEAIKMAPVIKALQNHSDVEVIITVTAQHREMLDQVLKLFDIHPHFDLNVMSKEQTLSELTSKVLLGLNDVFYKSRPDFVVVHGDTTTSFVSALTAFYHRIPIGHVEAGLRTWNKYSPYPEEMNRKLTGSLCDLHFAPTETARQNLIREGVLHEKIYVTGNTVIDALLSVVVKDYTFQDQELQSLNFNSEKVLLLTCHRRENLGEPMREIFAAIRSVILCHSDVHLVFPMHKNPAVRNVAKEVFAGVPRVHLIEPLEYKAFSNLMNKAYLILTDSGGIQEEAPSVGVPVLVLRNTTERPEAVEAGTVCLVGTAFNTIKIEIERLLNDNGRYEQFSKTNNPYGDGHASQRITALLLEKIQENRFTMDARF
jgi:UDP-N-acetylglucosamine 2-epimerase (non-hydrolysing)